MRLLFVNQYYPPDAAATSHLLGELTEDLAKHHEVWVVAGRPSYGAGTGTYQPGHVHVSRIRSTTFNRARMAGRLSNYVTFLVGALIRTQMAPPPDVVVAMTDPPVVGLVGLLAARRHRCPFVYVCEDIFPDVAVALGLMTNPLAIRGWRRLNRLLWREASRVVAIGRDMVEKLESEGVAMEKIAFLPNWSCGPSLKAGERAATRQSMGWEDRFVVMHAGNVGLAQNLLTLVEAAERLRTRPEILIVFLGDGAGKRALEVHVAAQRLHNVAFLPQVSKQQAQAIMGAADLHVISLAPGLCGSVVPSKTYGIMALGLPFVAAVETKSEVARIIHDAGSGIRVNPGDEEALAQAIRGFADGDVDAQDAGVRARTEFEKKYTRLAASERYLHLLREVAGGAAASNGISGNN